MTMPNMSNSSAASSGTGDQTTAGNVFNGGSVNFGAASSSGLSPVMWMAVAAVAVLWIISNKKR